MNKVIEKLIRPEIRALSAYHVPPADGLIKLDAMENPYPMPEALRRDWLAALQGAALNRYPEPSGEQVRVALREAMAIPDSQSILLGNGSDELIQILAMAVGEGGVIMAPEPSFVMYRMIATLTGMTFAELPLRPDDFSLDLPEALARIERHAPKLIFLAYPNNPTGNHWARADIERILEAAPGLVVLDEAYEPFADDSFLGDLDRYDNLLVMRTLSKFGLAGLRLGYLVGAGAWLNEFDKIRLPYNINTLTQISAAFALRRHEVFREQAGRIRADRAALFEALDNLPGLEVFPSAANFILFRTPQGRAEAIHAALLEQGVLIKKLDGGHPLLRDCLRVTVGTPDENRRFLEALRGAMG
ncbi:MAG TPA: histidinol-phosphate transaminase [Gammaproteobacteria bacterium]|nr:histidinol-phosphate transaminase [Gammaproteobacteria bacterium]